MTAMGSLARKRGQKGRDLVADEKWGMDKGSLNPTGPWHPSLRPERGPRRGGRRRPSLPLPAALPPALALPADTRAPARPGWVRARTVLRMRGVPGAGNRQESAFPRCAPASWGGAQVGRGLGAARALGLAPTFFWRERRTCTFFPSNCLVVGRGPRLCPESGTWAQGRPGCGGVPQRSPARAPQILGHSPQYQGLPNLVKSFREILMKTPQKY